MLPAQISELIQRRRIQLLIHSCIYYRLNENIISDFQFDKWSEELVKLQADYPEISKQVRFYDAFKDFDGSTGAFLPIADPWVIGHADYLLKISKEVSLCTTEK
jgi:hypothetical protein